MVNALWRFAVVSGFVRESKTKRDPTNSRAESSRAVSVSRRLFSSRRYQPLQSRHLVMLTIINTAKAEKTNHSRRSNENSGLSAR